VGVTSYLYNTHSNSPK